MARREPLRLPSQLSPIFDLRHWLGYELVYVGKPKPRKQPIQPWPPFELARVNDLSTAGSLNEALDACEVHRRTDGIGFMILKSGIAAIDLDDCISKDGTIAQWAEKLVARANSYTERTWSGEGLRILGFDEGKPVHTRRSMPVGKVEYFFDCPRYIVVTGKVLPPARPMRSLGAIFDEIRASAPATSATPPRGRPGGTADVFDIHPATADPREVLRRLRLTKKWAVRMRAVIAPRFLEVHNLGRDVLKAGGDRNDIAVVLWHSKSFQSKWPGSLADLEREVAAVIAKGEQ